MGGGGRRLAAAAGAGRGEFREEVFASSGALARALVLRPDAAGLGEPPGRRDGEQFAALTIDTGDGAWFVSYGDWTAPWWGGKRTST